MQAEFSLALTLKPTYAATALLQLFTVFYVSLFPILADGVALGAAASTSQTSVQLIVFVAIMLHKVSKILV